MERMNSLTAKCEGDKLRGWNRGSQTPLRSGCFLSISQPSMYTCFSLMLVIAWSWDDCPSLTIASLYTMSQAGKSSFLCLSFSKGICSYKYSCPQKTSLYRSLAIKEPVTPSGYKEDLESGCLCSRRQQKTRVGNDHPLHSPVSAAGGSCYYYYPLYR